MNFFFQFSTFLFVLKKYYNCQIKLPTSNPCYNIILQIYFLNLQITFPKYYFHSYLHKMLCHHIASHVHPMEALINSLFKALLSKLI